jgi:hypothetical protein
VLANPLKRNIPNQFRGGSRSLFALILRIFHVSMTGCLLLPVLLPAGSLTLFRTSKFGERKKMGSKTIMDSEALLDEDLLTLEQAADELPVRCSQSTLQRYLRGNGNVLETIYIFGRRYTSRQAIDRFLRGQLRVEPDRAPPKQGAKTRRDIEAACKKYGLPTPLGTPDTQSNTKRAACQSDKSGKSKKKDSNLNH